MGPLQRLHRLFAQLQCLLGWGVLAGALWAGNAVAAPTTEGQGNRPATVQVQEGDMASVLAFRLKPRGATIEQMMVALLRYNPQAFLQGNVNLLRDGATLRLPPAEEVLQTPAEEAKDTVQRHHNNFLRDLEGTMAKALPATSAEPRAQGAASAPAPDPAAEREALLEKLRTAKARLNELQQNIQELERLTRDGEAAPPPPSTAETNGIPNAWIWLGVAAIVAVMIGVGASRRTHKKPPPASVEQAHVAAEFQARLGGLDLNLDSPPGPSFPDRLQ